MDNNDFRALVARYGYTVTDDQVTTVWVGDEAYAAAMPARIAATDHALRDDPSGKSLNGVFGFPYPVTLDERPRESLTDADRATLAHVHHAHDWECYDGIFTSAQLADAHAFHHDNVRAQLGVMPMHKVTDVRTSPVSGWIVT